MGLYHTQLKNESLEVKQTRKLAWFIIIFVLTIPWIIAAGLAWPEPVGNGLHLIFVKTIGEGGANLIIGAVTGLFLWGSANGLQAAAVLFSVWIAGGIMWLGFKRAVSRKPRLAQKLHVTTNKETAIIREEPRDIITTESALPVKTKVEEEKKEVTPVESTS